MAHSTYQELSPRESTLDFIRFFAYNYRSIALADGSQLDLMLN